MDSFHTIIGANGDMIHFEGDQSKSAANKLKHGIDFVEAQRLWLGPALVEIPARSEDEMRWLVVAVIDGKHWSAVITHRGRRVRLVSSRRSRDEEVALYEGR